MRSQLSPCTKNSTRFLFRDCISVRGVLQYKRNESPEVESCGIPRCIGNYSLRYAAVIPVGCKQVAFADIHCHFLSGSSERKRLHGAYIR